MIRLNTLNLTRSNHGECCSTLIFTRHATPYHAPLYLAQSKGYFKDEGLKVALLEPNDPSDVTEIIGSGKVDMGFKAMIHTLAVCAPNGSINLY